MGTSKSPKSAPWTGVHILLTPDDQAALKTEAVRRVVDGECRRVDVSAIVRDLVRLWREGAIG